ncbi:MAG: aminoacetone oxidase family FAD-binding enzyme [Clostridia bacterium]|nr:aminoacetone oxidase family FAD-binding enzyme [Clostridia bacterium]
MNKIYQTAIIGGGSAGLMTAVELVSGSDALKGSDVVILERNDRVGKKLIATGNGQGNLTNLNFGAEFFYGNSNFINAFIESAKEINLIEYLKKLGIYTFANKEGKVYPLSRQASSVLDTIRLYLNKRGVEEITSCKVNKVEREGNKYKIQAEGKTFYAINVVFAFGGAVAKQFGTDGSAYALLEGFGHKCTKTYPSLVQLKTELDKIRGLKGLKEVAKVTAIKGGKELMSVTGDLLFTEFGVSGSTIFSLSACVVDKEDVTLKVEFLPDLNQEQIESILLDREQYCAHLQDEYLLGLINKRVGQAVLKAARSKCAKDVAFALKNFTLNVTGNLGANYAQVTKGGIKTDYVDENSYQSKLTKNLYIIGEALDVDGDCGGYNLTFAFVSAIKCAKSIKQSIR